MHSFKHFDATERSLFQLHESTIKACSV